MKYYKARERSCVPLLDTQGTGPPQSCPAPPPLLWLRGRFFRRSITGSSPLECGGAHTPSPTATKGKPLTAGAPLQRGEEAGTAFTIYPNRLARNTVKLHPAVILHES